MRIIILYILVFGAIPFILYKPYIGALVWAWIAYMAPQNYTWGLTQIPFAQVVAIVTIGAWLISREPKRPPLAGIIGVLILFVVWMWVTTQFALDQAAAKRQSDEVIKIIAMSLVTFLLIQSRQRIFWLLVVIVASIGFYGVKGGFFVFATGGEYRVLGPPGGGLEANNAIGLALVMLIPLMRYIQLEVKSPPITWLLWIAIGLCGLSILATYSRGAFLALLAMAAFMSIRSRYVLLAAPVVALGLFVGSSLMPDKWTSRTESILEYETDLSAMSRLRMWGYGWSVATARPVLGGGFGVYPATQLYPRFGFALCDPGVENEITDNCTTKGRSAHNIFMEVLGEHGFIGLGLFLLLGALAFRTCGWLKRVSAQRPDLDLAWAGNLGRLAQVSMVGYVVGGMFMDKAYFDLYYHLIVILAAAAVVVKQELSTEPVASEAAAHDVAAQGLKPLEKTR